MVNIVLFGPPGSGKGTQSEKLIQKFQLIHISTGDLLRAEIAANSPLGYEAKSFIDAGKLLPDEVVIGMISKKMDEHADAGGFIFDGFPRTIAQAKALDVLLNAKDQDITRVLLLEVSETELVKRLLNRGKTSGRTDDQSEATIRQRFNEYKTKTEPVAGYYSAQQKLSRIKGEGSIDEIFNRLVSAIKEQKIAHS